MQVIKADCKKLAKHEFFITLTLHDKFLLKRYKDNYLRLVLRYKDKKFEFNANDVFIDRCHNQIRFNLKNHRMQIPENAKVEIELELHTFARYIPQVITIKGYLRLNNQYQTRRKPYDKRIGKRKTQE